MKPPSLKQRELAEKLDIGHLITMDTSSQKAALLIRKELDFRREVREKNKEKQEGKQRREKLAELIAEGLSIGAEVFVYDSVRYVKFIDHLSGYVYCVGDRFGSLVSPLYIKLIKKAPDPYIDPDSWAPAGFIKLTPSQAKKVQKGDCGEEAKDKLIRRDLFLSKKQLWFLPGRFASKLQFHRFRHHRSL